MLIICRMMRDETNVRRHKMNLGKDKMMEVEAGNTEKAQRKRMEDGQGHGERTTTTALHSQPVGGDVHDAMRM
jgi:hypothetical protein